MDRKSIIVVAVCFVLLLLTPRLSNTLFPPKPLPPGATNVVTETPASAPTGATATAATPPPSLAPATTPKPAFFTNVPEETLVLKNDNARYTFTSLRRRIETGRTGALPTDGFASSKKQPLTNGVASLNTHVSVPVLAVLGDESVQGDGIFTLIKTTAGSVRAEKTLTNGLRLVKEFQLSTNYLVSANVRLENTSGQPLRLPAQEWVDRHSHADGAGRQRTDCRTDVV